MFEVEDDVPPPDETTPRMQVRVQLNALPIGNKALWVPNDFFNEAGVRSLVSFMQKKKEGTFTVRVHEKDGVDGVRVWRKS